MKKYFQHTVAAMGIAGVAVFVVMILALLVGGCGSEKKDDHLKIVTSIYPIYLDALNITLGVKGVEVVNLIDTRPQNYQITPEDMKTFEAADIFIINGLGMENFLDDVKTAYPDLKIIDASDTPDIVPIVNDGVPNPNVWLSVTYSIHQVKNISSKLCELDPERAENYKMHTLEYADELTTLRDELHLSLDLLPDKSAVTLPAEFAYMAAEFKMNAATPNTDTDEKILQLDSIDTGEPELKKFFDYVERMLTNTINLAKALR